MILLPKKNNINDDSNINNNDVNNDINEISGDMNINVLKVVNNNIDELNNSIKNILKEEMPILNKDKDIIMHNSIKSNNNNNIFNNNNKSLRELLKLDQQHNSDINNKIDKEIKENEVNKEININKEDSEVINKMSIEAIKEVKEEYEYDEDKDNGINFNNTDNLKDKNNEDRFNISNTNDLNVNIDMNNEGIKFDKNIWFSIIPLKKFDKRKFIIIRLMKNIEQKTNYFNLKFELIFAYNNFHQLI